MVSQVHGVKPRPREHEPQHAIERQSFLDADCDFDSQAGDVGVRPATTCIAWNPDGSSPASNSAHRTVPLLIL